MLITPPFLFFGTLSSGSRPLDYTNERRGEKRVFCPIRQTLAFIRLETGFRNLKLGKKIGLLHSLLTFILIYKNKRPKLSTIFQRTFLRAKGG